jgi:hypothetical protein
LTYQEADLVDIIEEDKQNDIGSIVFVTRTLVKRNSCFITLKKIIFLVMAPSWIQDGADGHNFERGPPKDHFSKVWLRLAK